MFVVYEVRGRSSTVVNTWLIFVGLDCLEVADIQ